MYGKELVLDIHECDINLFNRQDLQKFIIALCNLIDMEREDIYFWDYEDEDVDYENIPSHLKGVSVVQFITTSTIVIHTLDDLCTVFINIFSCKDFDEIETQDFVSNWFKGVVQNKSVLVRE